MRDRQDSRAQPDLAGSATASSGSPYASPLANRYTTLDLSVLDEEERRRFLGGAGGDLPPGASDAALAWELLYRLEPALYDRLVSAEALHPAILDWLPRQLDRVLEVGAGSGRLTLQLAGRCRELVAVEPAAPMRRLLEHKLEDRGRQERVRVVRGFFDSIPVGDDWADLVVACSSLTPDPAHGGDPGLREMERCCRPGGRIVVIWPNHLDWLASRGYAYRSFPGRMHMRFDSLEDAVALAEIFYPHAAADIRRLGNRDVPYEVLGIQPPRDVAYKDKACTGSRSHRPSTARQQT